MIVWTLVLSLILFGLGVASWQYRVWSLESTAEPVDVPPEPSIEPTPVAKPMKTEELYTLSKSLLGIHLGKDTSIPWMVNCANACSDVLIRFGITGLGAKGIPGTAQLLAFLEHSSQFAERTEYKPGCVIIAATGTGNGKIRGHVGICGNTSIMSNNSETGKWDTQWDIDRWLAYYTQYGGIHTRYFEPV